MLFVIVDGIFARLTVARLAARQFLQSVLSPVDDERIARVDLGIGARRAEVRPVGALDSQHEDAFGSEIQLAERAVGDPIARPGVDLGDRYSSWSPSS